VLFYAYMSMLLCDCQSFIKESYLLTYLLIKSVTKLHDKITFGTDKNHKKNCKKTMANIFCQPEKSTKLV